jgi:SAM-dependent methyltransferase
MSNTAGRLGDFTGLATDYAKYRQGYSASVLTSVLALIDLPTASIDAVDLGAGTGIWSRQVAARNVKSVTAVEPNADMRQTGSSHPASSVRWVAGSGEATGLADGSADLVSAASSFHWMDYPVTAKEIQRVLRPGGRFVALWNPRFIEASPLLVEIEGYLAELAPNMRRVSSGRSSFTDTLSERLASTPGFEDLLYLEGRHTAQQSCEEYLGAWRSVNDVQSQLGPTAWATFMKRVEQKISGLSVIETVFLTRAWTVRKAA